MNAKQALPETGLTFVGTILINWRHQVLIGRSGPHYVEHRGVGIGALRI